MRLFTPSDGPSWLPRFSDSILALFRSVMPAPFRLKSYDVADLPTAADWTAGLVFVPNESGGAVPAFSDGTNWRRVTDRAVVS